MKLHHFQEDGLCYFLTSTTYGRKPLFQVNRHAEILCKIIYNIRERGKILLLGFVIMPEHFHLLVVPIEGVKISWVMQEIKKGSARLINKERVCLAQGRAQLSDGKFDSRYSGSSLTPNKVWMDEYYDYIIRDEADLMKHLNYIFYNPIKRGLVQLPEAYMWTSANSKFKNDLEKIMSGSGTSPTT